MNQEVLDKILKLLKEKESLIDFSLSVFDYPTLKEKVLQLELKQEIEAVKQMLLNPDSFEDKFKKRCVQRELTEIPTIPFSVLLQSETNLLYWNIAELIFEPKSMKEMLDLLVPNNKIYIEAACKKEMFVFQEKEGLSVLERRTEYKKQIQNFAKKQCELIGEEEPILIVDRDSVALKKINPSIEELSHYVLTENIIFNVQSMARFSLRTQASLHQILNDKYPKLTKQIYAHNSDLEQLIFDINILNGRGLTPRSAMKQLIDKLSMSGTRTTGNELANEKAYKAVMQFYNYFKKLPKDIQMNLSALEYAKNKTLGTIMANEIEKGECIETTESHLSALLRENSSEDVLNNFTEINFEELKELESKYTRVRKIKEDKNVFDLMEPTEVVGTQKSSLLDPELPKEFIKIAIENIAPDSLGGVISLLFDFPSKFYPDLLEHIKLSKPSEDLEEIAFAIKNGFFSFEQTHALAKALSAYSHRFNLDKFLLFWALNTNLLFLKEALDLRSNEDRLEVVNMTNQYNNTILHCALSNFEALKIILEFLPPKDRLEAVKMTRNESKQTLLHYALDKPGSLKVILELLPEQDKLKAVKLSNEKSYTILHYLASDLESLAMVLGNLPEQDRFEAIINNEKQLVLHYVSREALKIILKYLPEEDRLFFLKMKIKKHPIWELVQYQINSLSKEEEFKNSFIPDFIAVITFLKKKKKSETKQAEFFSDSSGASKLMEFLNKMDTFDEIKKHLIDCVSSNSEDPLIKSLLSHLGMNYNSEIQSQLEQRWHLITNQNTNKI